MAATNGPTGVVIASPYDLIRLEADLARGLYAKRCSLGSWIEADTTPAFYPSVRPQGSMRPLSLA